MEELGPTYRLAPVCALGSGRHGLLFAPQNLGLEGRKIIGRGLEGKKLGGWRNSNMSC